MTTQRSASSPKEIVALRKEVSIWSEVSRTGYANAAILKSLKAVPKHRPVAFLKHVKTNLDLKIRRDTDDVRIERRVMELAERKAVGNHGLSQGMAIRKDMRSFK